MPDTAPEEKTSAAGPRLWLFAALALVAVVLCYSNHFQNGFHFDDSHAVEQNPWIRSLGNLPRIFTDATAFSTLPANQTWRPLVTASLAVDYWLGGGLKPFWFQFSTFIWFLVQLGTMFVLFRVILRKVEDSATADYAALFATAWFGLHPAMAETVNYVIQRGDLYSTLGVVASLALYAALPGSRGNYLYVLPVAISMLAKLPGVIFPGVLAAYICLFEEWTLAALAVPVVAAVLATVPLATFSGWMTPATYTPAASATAAYLWTQPYIALHYFVSFFLPVSLTADSDFNPLSSPLTGEGIAGFLFLGVLLAAIWNTRQSRWLRPVCFGLVWFLLGLLPTSLFPLAEVENDHRMFLPFVGLALAVTWVAVLLLRTSVRVPRPAVMAAAVLVLVAYGQGAWQRNMVWHSEEGLWKDVAEKSPRNGRGLMNYGLTLMGRGATADALGYFERALEFTPNYYVLEINLGVAHGVLGHDQQAEVHFQRARQLAPADAQPPYFFGRWLHQKRRTPEAVAILEAAVRMNPAYLEPRYELMSAYTESGAASQARALAEDTLRIVPGDATALRFRNAQSVAQVSAPSAPPVQASQTADDFLNMSLTLNQAHRYEESIRAAEQALKLRPNYAEAWNNIAAANEELKRWDAAIAAASQAIRIKPDFQLARNNLAWAMSEKAKAGR